MSTGSRKPERSVTPCQPSRCMAGTGLPWAGLDLLHVEKDGLDGAGCARGQGSMGDCRPSPAVNQVVPDHKRPDGCYDATLALLISSRRPQRRWSRKAVVASAGITIRADRCARAVKMTILPFHANICLFSSRNGQEIDARVKEKTKPFLAWVEESQQQGILEQAKIEAALEDFGARK